MGGVWNKDGGPASLMSVGMAVFGVVTFQWFLGSAGGMRGMRQSSTAQELFQHFVLDHCLHRASDSRFL